MRVLPTARSCTRPIGSSRSTRASASCCPWILIAVLGVIIIVGLIVWYMHALGQQERAERRRPAGRRAVTRCRPTASRCRSRGRRTATRRASCSARTPQSNAKADKGSTVHLTRVHGQGGGDGAERGRRTQGDARDQLVNAGFTVTTAQVTSASPPAPLSPRIPRPARRRRPGRRSASTSRRGQRNVQVPSQVGNPVDDAKANPSALGFKPVVDAGAFGHNRRAPWSAQSPSGGSAPKGSTVC